MKNLKKLAVDHPYYCSDSNYYSNEPQETYGTMTDFLDEFESADIDMNLMFRWDINQDEDNPELFTAEIFLMLQRKGIFKPVFIQAVCEEETDRFNAYALAHWEVMQKMWNPIASIN